MRGFKAAVILGVLTLAPTLALADDSRIAKYPIERAEGPDLATAIGYYARTRALLVTALREFDKGRAKGDPSSLLDTDLWRHTIEDRISDLDRVLSPQPRATRDGVAFEPDSRLIGGGGK